MSNTKNQPSRLTALFWLGLGFAVAAGLTALIISLLRRRRPTQELRQSTTVEFKAARLFVTVPALDQPTLVVTLDSPEDRFLRNPEQDEFDPRLPPLINFDVRNAYTNQTITRFSPPLVIEMEYTQEQLNAAQALAKELGTASSERESSIRAIRVPAQFSVDNPRPLLGYWNGQYWVLFKAKHNLQYLPPRSPDAVGLVRAEVSDWADPPIAWYP